MQLEALALLLCVSCAGPSDLSPEAVTSIPSGNASGSALGGVYSVSGYVTSCAGDCSFRGRGVCDVGRRESGTVMVMQTDGRLRIDPDGSQLAVTHLEGGIYQDGHFDVGGLATQLGGAIQVTARVTGTVTAARKLQAGLRAHVEGSVQGDQLDCYVVADLTGQSR